MDAPNVVFIFTDQQHWHAAGYMDPFYATPALDGLAADGTVFTRAYCTTPQCSPSRSSLMTGYYPHRTGVMGNIGAAGGGVLTMDTVGKKLQAAGYRTGYFGKWHIGEDTNGTAGWDEQFGLKGNHHHDRMHPHLACDFIGRNAGNGRPFALYVSINDPHDVYHYGRGARAEEDVRAGLPASYAAQDFGSVPVVQERFMTEDQGRVIHGKPDDEWREYRKLYRAKVKLADDIVDAVIRKLKETGAYDESLVIFTSDHGDMDTHNRLIFKGPFMYDHTLRVPLVIKWPGAENGVRSEGLTVNTDLVPTILDYAGLSTDGYDGHSLKPLLESKADGTGHDKIIAQYYGKQEWVNPIRTVVSERFKYNRYLQQGEELYDLASDPDEVRNLAGDPAYASVVAGMTGMLDAWMREHDDPFETLVLTDRAGASV